MSINCKAFLRGASALIGVSASALMATPASAYDGGGAAYYAYDGGATFSPGASDYGFTPLSGAGGGGASFDGVSQMDVRALNGNSSYIPPDTMGAVGASQFFETTNGAYAIFDKATGARQSILSMNAFWQAAGQAGGSNGDSRVLFDASSQKWIVMAFAATDANGNLPSLEIAVSNDSNALDGFKSTTFTAFNPVGSAPIADYPTLAIDSKAVYIGTNDFDLNAKQQFAGTTLTVINRRDLFGSSGPKVQTFTQFFAPCTTTACTDRGFAVQGVNQLGSDTGKVLATAATDYGQITYNVNDPGTNHATETGAVTLDNTPYDSNFPARQPDLTTRGTTSARVVDTLDDRTSSAVWEQGGKIYSTQTITPTGTDHTAVRWSIVDAKTQKVISEGYVGNNNDGFDYFQGSITVNKHGQVVIGYNRSGSNPLTGNISVYANEYNPNRSGGLTLLKQVLMHVSPIDDYHNGSTQFAPPVGRQRWGDYAQVTVDPNNPESFWVVGEYALGYLPGATTSFSRWGTWITDIKFGDGSDGGGDNGGDGGQGGNSQGSNLSGGPNLPGAFAPAPLTAVPEPAAWGLMLMGFGLVGRTLRRRAGSAATA